MQSVRVVLILLVIVVASATAYPTPNHYPNGQPHYDLNNAPALFQKFINDHNRQYVDEEDYYKHYFAFFKNLIDINQLNEHSGSARFDITQFADYTKEDQSPHALISPGPNH